MTTDIEQDNSNLILYLSFYLLLIFHSAHRLSISNKLENFHL